MYLLLFQVDQLTKQLPDGEKALLHWIIYILIAILIIVVTYFIRKTARSDKQILDLSKESIVHISKTNQVISDLSGVIKDNTTAGQGIKEAFNGFKDEMKLRRELERDFLPTILQAVTKKES